MQHPNFAKLPGDLFCADHVNKMTVPYTESLCKYAGFDLVADDCGGVMFYFVLQHGEKGEIPNEFESSKEIADNCTLIAQSTMSAIKSAADHAGNNGSKFGVFGSTSIAFMAPFFLDCDADPDCYIDENPNIRGKLVGEIPVVSLKDMVNRNITDVALATSPVYWDLIAEKLQQFKVRVHLPMLT